MTPNTPITFWLERVEYSRNSAVTPHRTILEMVPAEWLSVSEPICAVCREPEGTRSASGVFVKTHNRPPRKHIFAPMDDSGSTIWVHYPNGVTETRHNVMQGRAANCWTLNSEEQS